MGWQMPVSCFDCQCKILSDPILDVMEAVDWSLFLFLERYAGKGRHHAHSRIGLLKALVYLELSEISSVHELLRVLERDPYKMKILGLDRLPDDSVFSRFKVKLGKYMDRMIGMLTGMLHKLHPSLFTGLGVDSTKVDAHTRRDKQAGWGYDHIAKKYYKGYKVHLLYNMRLLVPVSYVITSASVHDNTQLRRLVGKLGPGIIQASVVLGDRSYDSKANVEEFTGVGVTMINPKNKRNSKKVKGKYRLQDYCKIHGNMLNHIYKNRMDCEVTNNLLKEHLHLTEIRTIGRLRTRVKTGLTILTRQIHVLHQLAHDRTTRTAIIT